MLALGRKAVTNLDRILKSRGITLLTKLRFCRVWIWELDYKESWVPKNWCFWPVVLEKTLESPLDIKEVQPVHPKGNNPEYSLEGLKLKLQYSGKEPTHWKRPWYWERLKAGGEGGDREWDGWMASLTQWTWIWAKSRRQWRTQEPGLLQSTGLT